MKGIEDKEIANLPLDRRENKNLKSLKAMGGPFASSGQVDEFFESGTESNTKLSRLHIKGKWYKHMLLSRFAWAMLGPAWKSLLHKANDAQVK